MQGTLAQMGEEWRGSDVVKKYGNLVHKREHPGTLRNMAVVHAYVRAKLQPNRWRGDSRR